MTTREWFRLQRRALWERKDTLASDIDLIAAAVVDGVPVREWRRVGELYWTESVGSYEERERLLARVRAQMDEALRRMMSDDYA